MIFLFGESVGFRVAGTRVNQLEAETFTPILQYLANELWAVVSLDLFRYAKPTDHVVLEEIDDFRIPNLY